MATTLWVQAWEESERGWGTRPDGYTMHMKREDISAFLSDMRKAEAEIYKGSVPDEYSRPVGEPYEWECKDAKLVAEVKASGHGLWGSGNKYPPKKQ